MVKRLCVAWVKGLFLPTFLARRTLAFLPAASLGQPSSRLVTPRAVSTKRYSASSRESLRLSLKTPSVWGQQVVSLTPGPFAKHSTESGNQSGKYTLDITEELALRGLPELEELREGVAFFHLTKGNATLGVTGAAGAIDNVVMEGRAVGVPISEGSLGDGSTDTGPRILLIRGQEHTGGEGGEAAGDDCTVTVTWNGAKYRQGASHHCADRETETSGPRKDALDTALQSLGMEIQELLESDQLSGSGSSAVRTYYSFTRPRPGRNHDYADRDVELSASRAANQIAFFVRAFRAEQSEYIRNRDRALQELKEEGVPMHPLVLVLDNVRSAFNVGSIFRTAETARVEEVLTCGFTPHPPHAKLDKTAFSSVLTVPNRHFNNTVDAVRSLKERGYEVWAMETTSRSEVYTNISYPPTGVALVLGNEVIGVDAQVLELCDRIVEIPTFGKKNSLNVASACPVVVFECLRQWKAFPTI